MYVWLSVVLVDRGRGVDQTSNSGRGVCGAMFRLAAGWFECVCGVRACVCACVCDVCVRACVCVCVLT